MCSYNNSMRLEVVAGNVIEGKIAWQARGTPN